MAQFPFVDRGVGLVGKYGPGAGKGQWGAWAQGGLRRGRKRSPERGGAGFILYLIKAGLLPVRFRPPIAGAVGRWPEGEAEGL